MKGNGRTGEEGVKQQQQQPPMRKREETEASPVTQDLLLLRLLPLDPEVLEIHIVQLGPEGRKGETNPTGRESGPCAQLLV